MRLRLLLPLGLAFTVAALLALAPARLVAWVLPASALAADGYDGTLWRGSAARALAATPGGYFHLGSLEWRLSPLSLLTLRPSLAFETAWGDQRFSGRLRLLAGGRVALRDVSFGLDAAVLRQLAPVMVSGRVSGQLEKLVVDAGVPETLTGRLTWERAAWDAPGSSFSLGSYAVDFAPANGDVRGEVVTLAGPLLASGAVVLTGRRYRAELDLAGEGPLSPALANALSLIAAPTDDGYRLRVNGTI